MHSTETTVTCFADEILVTMDKGLVTSSVFIDLVKARSTLLTILISKLQHYGVCDEAFPVLRTIFREESSWCAIISGVLQRSIVGPLLFISIMTLDFVY